jgi:hypothetical protein
VWKLTLYFNEGIVLHQEYPTREKALAHGHAEVFWNNVQRWTVQGTDDQGRIVFTEFDPRGVCGTQYL